MFTNPNLEIRRWAASFLSNYKTLLSILWMFAFLSVFIFQRPNFDGLLVFKQVGVRPIPRLRPNVVNITDFGAVGDGVTDNTVAFERAVSEIGKYSEKGGGQINVLSGVWLTCPFNLTSHLTLFLAENAVILGVDDEKKWTLMPPLPSYGYGREHPGSQYGSLIHGQNLKDVVITGHNGTIDGQGETWWKKFRQKLLNYTRGPLIQIMWSADIVVSNITLRNSPFWTLHPYDCKNVTIQNVTILNPLLEAPNTDGIDPEGSLHPYQQTTKGGINPKSPQGAYEARKVKPGLYIRVDITFSGKAPPVWTEFDSPGTRTYAGFVVIDRDIADVDFVTELKNGCFRMFFPLCDGSLNFLSLPSSSPPSVFTVPENDDKGEEDEEEIVIDFPIITTAVAHDSRHPSGMRLVGGCPDHINPYLLSGIKGVYEHKTVTLTNGDHLIYIRVDLPDTTMDSTALAEDFKNGILFMTEVEKKDYYSRFDEETREYHGLLAPVCDCCKLRVVKYENVNGVLRFLARKISVDKNNVVPNQVRLITQ